MITLSEIFGIETTTPELYKKALTHSSYINDKDLPYTDCYERFEFLGDAVLKLTVSDVLFKKFPDAHEGKLSKIRSIIVSDATLAQIAKQNGLSDLIILAPHEEKQGTRNIDSICACAFEAVLGAYYLDGKYTELVKYIEKTFEPYIDDVKDNFVSYNAKEILQEYTQSKTKTRPTYRVINETGPAHKKKFTVEVFYDGKVLAVEKGFSKKEAEQKCAYTACKLLELI